MERPTPAPPPPPPQARKPTHDFLSNLLYTTTTATTANSSSQDTTTTRPPPGSFPTTHNFLQPLEVATASKPVEQAHILTPSASSVEHILPGGIGTYTISHISCVNQIPKPDVSISTVRNSNDDNSNSTSSQTGSGCGFTLWEQSAVNKGITGKDNNVGDRTLIVREPSPKLGQWCAERQLQSSFNQRSSFAPASSSQLQVRGNNRSFMDLMVATKSTRDDIEDCEVDFVIKKEGSPSDREDFAMRTDGNTGERKANTPRSKHSATEQRRRSKINDRFQMLREIIPHSDQKRDKASFLLEAIEYIQYLQGKVHKYEGTFPGWNHDSSKQMPLRTKCQPAQGFIDNCGPIHGGSAATPILSVKMSEKNIGASSTISRVVNMDADSEIINPIVVCPIPSQPKIFVEGSGKSHFQHFPVHDTGNGTSQHRQRGDVSESKIVCAIPNNELKDQEVAIEGGTINISSAYSQGFLNKLTQALQGLGVDLSKSRISVQIDLGKQNKIKLCSPDTAKKVEELNLINQVKAANSWLPGTSEHSDQPVKRLKTGGNHL